MEAATGFEPVIRALQARALPLGYAAVPPARLQVLRNERNSGVNRDPGVASIAAAGHSSRLLRSDGRKQNTLSRQLEYGAPIRVFDGTQQLCLRGV
jgi:hypothetical protein